jgi:hypothetical protein
VVPAPSTFRELPVLRQLLFVPLLACIQAAFAAPAPGLLLHYTFDGDGTGQCTDSSGNGLDGAADGVRVDSPSGRAMSFDGTASTVVRLTVPERLALGKGSWSFMAWIRPQHLAIDDPQNQRRIFSYGAYPDANMVIDVTASGSVAPYLCYRAGDGRIVSAGASSQPQVAENAWALVAVVCDRQARTISTYVDGYCDGPVPLPAGFEGDFAEHREVTIGGAWHNFWGAMDEVRVYRRALSRQEVKAEFEAHLRRNGVSAGSGRRTPRSRTGGIGRGRQGLGGR